MVVKADIKNKNNPAWHLNMTLVAGFASAAGNGSAVITGLSAASDAPMGCFIVAGTAANNKAINLGSVTFISNRVKIANTVSTNKSVIVFWWDEK